MTDEAVLLMKKLKLTKCPHCESFQLKLDSRIQCSCSTCWILCKGNGWDHGYSVAVAYVTPAFPSWTGIVDFFCAILVLILDFCFRGFSPPLHILGLSMLSNYQWLFFTSFKFLYHTYSKVADLWCYLPSLHLPTLTPSLPLCVMQSCYLTALVCVCRYVWKRESGV